MRITVLTLSALGVLIFGGAFILSFLDPLLVERGAREIVRIEVERKVGEKIDSLSNSKIAGLAHKALQKTGMDIERSEAAIRNELPRRVANIVADMLNADCECRKRLVANLQEAERERLSSLAQLRERLDTLIETAYASVSQSLMREFRIFTASNAAAFALLGVITLFRRRARQQLLLPALVIVSAVTITSGIYLFSQDWLHTIVFGQYVGLAYSFYLCGVALLLADIAFNRARVTTQIVNIMLEAIGSAATAIPC